jgi:di/tricarboxylate transporter
MIPWEGWFTLAVVGGAVVAMVFEWIEPPLGLGMALGVLLLGGAVTPQGALIGFSSTAVATVGGLLILSSTLEHSYWIHWLTARLLGDRAGRGGLLRVLTAVAGLSAFMANTAIIAVFIPAVRTWAQKRGVAPSKFLLPLSFAGIVGGACTLVGTSTNLVVHGMLEGVRGEGLRMFTLAGAGLPVAVGGILFLVVVGYRLLPDRRVPMDDVVRNPREYVSRLRVDSGSRLAGSRIEKLRRLDGLFLAGLEREGTLLSPVSPRTRIRVDDVLVFVGMLDKITQLATTYGLVPAIDPASPMETEMTHLVEVVVSPSSPLAGSTVREAQFRGHYDAVILGVHRHGRHVMARIGDLIFHPGDTLLLATGKDFMSTWRHSQDFYLVSEAGSMPLSLRARDWLEPAVLGAVVLVASIGWLSLFKATLAGVLGMLVSKRLTAHDAWRAINWPVLFTIAAAIGIGKAMQESGVASAIADGIGTLTVGMGAAGAVAAVFLATAILTEFVTNVAAAALMFPVALGLASRGDLELMPLAVAVALGASLCFATPFGYHTNAMVAGAAGYRFRDFLFLGVPMKILCVAVGTVAIVWIWSLA